MTADSVPLTVSGLQIVWLSGKRGQCEVQHPGQGHNYEQHRVPWGCDGLRCAAIRPGPTAVRQGAPTICSVPVPLYLLHL